jgi:hypothetical protein
MLFIAGKRDDVISLSEVDHANSALGEGIVALRIEFGTVEGLNKLGRCWHPLGPLGISHREEKNRDQDADEYANATTLKHLHVTK